MSTPPVPPRPLPARAPSSRPRHVSYLRWVRNDGDFTDCESDEDCIGVSGEGVGENLKCGALFGMDALNGGVTTEVLY